MTTIEITDQMVDRAERWLCGHDAWELPYGSTGSGEAARTILEAAFADPPVRGSADGLIEPGPPKVDVKQATENNNRLYGLLKGRMAGLEEDFLEFTDTTERDLEAFSVDLQKVSQEMTALREQVDTDTKAREAMMVRIHRGYQEIADNGEWTDLLSRMTGFTPKTPTTEPSDPGAGDDAEKWRAVTKTCFRANTFGEAAQAAVNEAVRQGLVQRIDPEDSEQHEAVMDAMRSVNHLLGWEEMDSLTTEVLVALAALKGGAR